MDIMGMGGQRYLYVHTCPTPVIDITMCLHISTHTHVLTSIPTLNEAETGGYLRVQRKLPSLHIICFEYHMEIQ